MATTDPFARLSPKERQAVEAVCTRGSTKSAAFDLGVCRKTICNRMTRAAGKTGLAGAPALCLALGRALERGAHDDGPSGH